jgi:hypothetical protein
VAGFILQTLLNMFDGILPASIIPMSNELNLSESAEGAIGGMIYVGLVFSLCFAERMFKKFSMKRLLASS